jgi:Lon protease-like protein
MEIPLFPLRTVLYPGGPLPLRIFEQRYLDMISRCLKEDAPFGVLLIREGAEVGPATTFDVGTLARITDWYQGSDGLLGVTATGGQRFRRISDRRQEDGLLVGEVELLPEPEDVALPAQYESLVKVLETVIDDLGRLYEGVEKRYDDAGWVGYRFAEILPVPPEQKQTCLETDDPLERLESMRVVLESVRL